MLHDTYLSIVTELINEIKNELDPLAKAKKSLGLAEFNYDYADKMVKSLGVNTNFSQSRKGWEWMRDGYRTQILCLRDTVMDLEEKAA